MRSVIIAGFLASFLESQAPPLRIVVLEGEGAVNIIQQKTAVRPLVEVRDRNNVPVAGATVTFTIGGGGQSAAFAGGVQTLTVTTNAAGQAAAGGLSALGSGAFQIQVQAAYQGQIATAAISQTNFATAAAASQAGAAGESTGGAAGGGGGISGTTIGIVGAAVAGGAVAATQVGGRDDGGGDASAGRRFTGPISGQFVMTTTTSSTSGSSTCVSTRTITGTLTITLRNDNASGRLETTGTQQEISVSGPACSPLPNPSVPFNLNGDVTGGPANLTYMLETSSSSTSPATVTVTVTSKFTGALSGDTITGTPGYQELSRGTHGPSAIAGSGRPALPSLCDNHGA
ncbi:MAG: hypothetical protein K2Y23_00440 [Cyanobacteria bacterium]|nr:hypothetical protein [Cyanobacteriota bacterium]